MEQTRAQWHRQLARRVVEELRTKDPDLLRQLTEAGLVRPPKSKDGTDSAPPRDESTLARVPSLQLAERLLERSVERRPSLLAQLGISALQALAVPTDEQRGGARIPTRLAVAFTDLEDFTEFTAREGDEAASKLLTEHHSTIGPIVRGRGGKLVKRLGDGLLLTFPEPEAAVLACLELVAAEPTPLRLRAGVNTGDVVVMRDDVIGHVVNVAARVTEVAKGGKVIVTSDVRRAVSSSLPQVEFGAPRQEQLKGISESVTVCEVALNALP